MENRAERLLESYFANSLSADEATELKTLTSSDPRIAAELGFQMRVASAVKPLALARGIQNAAWREAAQTPFPATAIKASMWPRFVYAAAASIALLIAAYIFLQPPNLQTIVANNATEYPNIMPFNTWGEQDKSYPQEVIKAFEPYRDKDFSKSAQTLQTIVAAYPDSLDYRFYWGVSLVKAKKYTEAVGALTPLVQSQYELEIPALYYLGLACAGAGDKDCARQNLQAFIDSNDANPKTKKQAQAVKDAL